MIFINIKFSIHIKNKMLKEADYWRLNFNEMARIIALNIETTGLSSSKNHLLEIWAFELIELRITGNIIKVFVEPRNPIEKQAFDLQGIGKTFFNESIKNYFKDSKAQLELLLNFIGDSLVVSHNAVFDRTFINKELIIGNCPI